MDGIFWGKDDLIDAREYVDVYMSLKNALQLGKIEASDAEEYLSYKEHMLSKIAKKWAKEMIENQCECIDL